VRDGDEYVGNGTASASWCTSTPPTRGGSRSSTWPTPCRIGRRWCA